MFPLRWFGRFALTQFEIAGVKKRSALALDPNLGRTKNVSGGEENRRKSIEGPRLAERQHMLFAVPGQTRLHQAGGAFRHNNFGMRSDMIAMRMRDKSETLRIPR